MKEDVMLKLTLHPDEYLVVGGNIVIQLTRVAGGMANLALDAPREVPIVRGAVLERQGGQRPACLGAPPKKKGAYYRDQVFRWNDDRERAVRAMKQVFDQLERDGAAEAAQTLRTQLDRILPQFWEKEITP